jgi:Tfp pilus assembly protein PilN
MYTIDLLKGQNLPVRTKPQGVAIFVTTFAVPALAAILVIGFYVRNEVIISVQKQNIASFESKAQQLADALKFKGSCEKEKAAVNSCLVDVADSIHRHIQWTPVLVTLVENLPESVVLTNLEVKRQSLKRKVAAKGDSNKKIDTYVMVRVLKMRVSGEPTSNCDVEVKAFRDRLRASAFLGPKLEDIVIASQGYDTLDGRDAITYNIDCIFKPES